MRASPFVLLGFPSFPSSVHVRSAWLKASAHWTFGNRVQAASAHVAPAPARNWKPTGANALRNKLEGFDREHQTGDEATKTGKTFKEGAGGKVASVCTLSGRGSPRAAKRPSITFCTQTRRRTPHGKGIQKLRERRGGECGMPLPPPLALFTRSRYAEEATWEKQGSFTRSGASRS